jgi:hypothetical protein
MAISRRKTMPKKTSLGRRCRALVSSYRAGDLKNPHIFQGFKSGRLVIDMDFAPRKTVQISTIAIDKF